MIVNTFPGDLSDISAITAILVMWSPKFYMVHMKLVHQLKSVFRVSTLLPLLLPLPDMVGEDLIAPEYKAVVEDNAMPIQGNLPKTYTSVVEEAYVL